MIRRLRVGIRPSRLSVKQSGEIARRLPSVKFETVKIATCGDLDKSTPLPETGRANFFTAEIEKALLCGDIDAAIHSAKDLEEDIPKGLVIAAITAPLSPYECLVSRGGLSLSDLPAGSKIGTSSAKRREAILAFRPDLNTAGIRGDIDERLAQLDAGKFDAVIVAHVALIRLGYEDRITEVIPPDLIRPHPLQGSLAIEVRRDRMDLLKLFGGLDAR